MQFYPKFKNRYDCWQSAEWVVPFFFFFWVRVLDWSLTYEWQDGVVCPFFSPLFWTLSFLDNDCKLLAWMAELPKSFLTPQLPNQWKYLLKCRQLCYLPNEMCLVCAVKPCEQSRHLLWFLFSGGGGVLPPLCCLSFLLLLHLSLCSFLAVRGTESKIYLYLWSQEKKQKTFFFPIFAVRKNIFRATMFITYWPFKRTTKSFMSNQVWVLLFCLFFWLQSDDWQSLTDFFF